MSGPGCDCVVIGYHDWDFRDFVKALEPTQKYSSAYLNVLKNTVHSGGRRLLFNELLGELMTKASGRPHRYNAFEVASLGGCYLTSFLRRRELGAELINFYTYDAAQLEAVLETRPRAAVITTTFYFMPQPVQQIVAFIRERSPETVIIVGGPYIYNICRDQEPTVQDMTLTSLGADLYVFDSQGELALSRVVQALKDGRAAHLSTIPNLIIRTRGGFTRTAREPENNCLDTESEAWESFPPSLIAPVAFVRTARSCAFACAFCTYPEMAGTLALKSIETVERELRALHDAGTRIIVFIDDTFNVPLPRFKKLTRMMIANRFDFRWLSFLRCGNLDDEALELAARSGCYGAVLGVESGDQTVLNNMNKAVNVERYEWGIRELHSRGIATSASFIIGFPGETRDSVSRTIDFIERSAPTFYVAEQYFHSGATPVARKSQLFQLRGSGYNWRHATMDWSESAELVGHVYRTVRNSRILPLYGLGLWGIPYLESKGLPLPVVQRFVELVQPMLIASMDGNYSGLPAQEAVVVDWLRDHVAHTSSAQAASF